MKSTGSVGEVGVAQGLDIDALGRLIRSSLGEHVALDDVQQVLPWTVARCHLDGLGAPHTVIVKWLRSNPEGFRVDRRQIATEASALTLMADVAPVITPALIAHDLDLLIIEDLAPRRTLHSVLSHGLTPAGLTGLHTFASTMANLHSATSTIATPGPWPDTARLPLGDDEASRLLDRLDELVLVSPLVRADVRAAWAEIDEPGPFEAFSNGDSGANNCLVAADGSDGRLIDFEHACRRHALLDAAALRVSGSMWMTMADPIPLGVEDTYRQAAGLGLPAVLDDDAYGLGLSAACALRALSKLQRFDKLDGRGRGHHSRPQLVTTIDGTIETMQRWGQFEALSAWLHELSMALRARWPDADVSFPNDYTLREAFHPDL